MLEKGAMTNVEERATGEVPFRIYYEYFTSAGMSVMIYTSFFYVSC